MRRPRVLVLYNEPVLPTTHPDSESEYEILYTLKHVVDTLTAGGFKAVAFGLGRDVSALVSCLREECPDVVFNLFEGAADHGDTETYVAGVLEWFGVPYTGSPPSALSLARRKHLTKYALRGAGIPTPEFIVIERLPLPELSLPWPVIVKPALEDASVGIDRDSVIDDPGRLAERVADLLTRYGAPVLVERFISGREVHASLIEAPNLRVLPLSEAIFPEGMPDSSRLLTYVAKWKPGTHEFESIGTRCPADLPPEWSRRVAELAQAAFYLIGCRGYGRVDFRLSSAGDPYVIEVNPNCDLSPVAGLANVLEVAQETWTDFVLRLVKQAGPVRPGTLDGCHAKLPPAVATSAQRPRARPARRRQPAARQPDGRGAG
jgi:D-alanine-D-alanine ligase